MGLTKWETAQLPHHGVNILFFAVLLRISSPLVLFKADFSVKEHSQNPLYKTIWFFHHYKIPLIRTSWPGPGLQEVGGLSRGVWMCCGFFVDIFSEEGVVAGFMTSTIIHLPVALGCFLEPDTSRGEPRNKCWRQWYYGACIQNQRAHYVHTIHVTGMCPRKVGMGVPASRVN